MRLASRGLRSRGRRRASALELQQERAKRTPKQQLQKLNAEGYTAKKERARLQKLIDAEAKNAK